MGLLDVFSDIMSGDVFYPDNPSRERRTRELVEDCRAIAGDLSILAGRVSELLAQFDDVVPGRNAQQQYGHWSLSVPQPLLSLMASPRMAQAMASAGASRMMESGELIPSTLTSIFGFLGVTSIVENSVRRDKLREAIHQVLTARLQLKREELVMKRLVDVLVSLGMAIKALRATLPPSVDLGVVLQANAETERAALEAISESKAAEVLTQLDNARQSWTNEDNLS